MKIQMDLQELLTFLQSVTGKPVSAELTATVDQPLDTRLARLEDRVYGDITAQLFDIRKRFSNNISSLARELADLRELIEGERDDQEDGEET